MKKQNNQRLQSLLLATIATIIFPLAIAAQEAVICGEKDYDCQITEGAKLIRANPKSAAGYSKRGDAYYNKGDYDRAIEDYTKVIEYDSQNATAYSYRADAYNEKSDYERAIKDYTKAIELDPKNVVTYIDRGNAYDNNGNFEAAIKDYDKALALDPNNASAYYNRGIAFASKEKYDRAISDYSKAIAIDATVSDYYYFRGVAYQKQHNNDKAVDDFGKTLKIDPNYAPAKDRLKEIIAEEESIIAKQNEITPKETPKPEKAPTSNSGLPAGTYACFTTVSIYAGRGGSGAYTYPIYNSSRQTRGSIDVQPNGTYRLSDGTTLHYSFNGSAIRWLDGTFAEASSSSIQSDNRGNPNIQIKFNGDKDVWDCTKQ